MGSPTRIVSAVTPRDLLDPAVAAVADRIPFDEITAEIIPSLRSAVGMGLQVSDAVERTDHVVMGDPDVRLRVHRPKGVDGVLPCVYSMHGGGYVIGTNAMDDPIFDELCPKLGFVGVSVEYRLAPETPYPGPLEDCYQGLRWTYEHADELHIDPERLGVMGVSAGGGLAAALALLARDRGEVPVAFQLLDSPMLDDRQITSSSQQDGLPVWSRGSNTFGGGATLSYPPAPTFPFPPPPPSKNPPPPRPPPLFLSVRARVPRPGKKNPPSRVRGGGVGGGRRSRGAAPHLKPPSPPPPPPQKKKSKPQGGGGAKSGGAGRGA